MTAYAALVPLAWAVCFSATAQNRMAFLGTTIFLTLLPLGLVAGAAVWWIWRAGRIADTEPEPPSYSPGA